MSFTQIKKTFPVGARKDFSQAVGAACYEPLATAMLQTELVPLLYHISLPVSNFLGVGTMATAKKLPSGSWRVNQYIGKDVDGKRKYKSFTADTKKEAEFLAAEYVLKNKTMLEQKVLGNLIDNYIENRKNILSPTTIDGYRKIRRNNFQQLMDLPIDKITNEVLQQAINLESLEKSPKTIENSIGLIKTVLKRNSYYRYEVTLPRKKKKRKDLPQPKVLLSLLKGTDIELPCLLAMWQSFRMSEIKGFKKSDIEDGVISVNRVMVYVEDHGYIVKELAKTDKSSRSLKLPEYLLSLINAVPDDQEYLVNMTGAMIYNRFVKLLKKNNVKPIAFHDLRSVNASIML